MHRSSIEVKKCSHGVGNGTPVGKVLLGKEKANEFSQHYSLDCYVFLCPEPSGTVIEVALVQPFLKRLLIAGRLQVERVRLASRRTLNVYYKMAETIFQIAGKRCMTSLAQFSQRTLEKEMPSAANT